jgi:hypothetical protein
VRLARDLTGAYELCPGIDDQPEPGDHGNRERDDPEAARAEASGEHDHRDEAEPTGGTFAEEERQEALDEDPPPATILFARTG